MQDATFSTSAEYALTPSQAALNLLTASSSVSSIAPTMVTCGSNSGPSNSERRADISFFSRGCTSSDGIPHTEYVQPRLKKLMSALRSEFEGPEFEPHVTIVGAIELTEDDAVTKFRAACDGVRAYSAAAVKVASGTFFYQCVFLLLHPTSQVVDASSHCTKHFGYQSSTPYMPHLSLLYANLSEEEKKKAVEKANALDESIGSLSFQISSLALYETDTEDKTLKSWKKVTECSLGG